MSGHACTVTFSDDLVCSARGCRRSAGWALVWNNPRVHSPDREKRWLACDEHRDHLGRFLAARGFLRRTDRLDRPDAPAGGPPPRTG
jgi:hypothetical protein